MTRPPSRPDALLPHSLSSFTLHPSAFILLLFLVSPGRASDDIIDTAMYKNPDLPVPRVVLTFPEEAKTLWLRALERPEVDLKCKAADAIALAHRRGGKGLQRTIAALRA